MKYYKIIFTLITIEFLVVGSGIGLSSALNQDTCKDLCNPHQIYFKLKDTFTNVSKENTNISNNVVGDIMTTTFFSFSLIPVTIGIYTGYYVLSYLGKDISWFVLELIMYLLLFYMAYYILTLIYALIPKKMQDKVNAFTSNIKTMWRLRNVRLP
jgi:hypothetical protein